MRDLAGLVAAWAAALTGAWMLAGALRATARPLPALTERDVVGAPLDAAVGGGAANRARRADELPPLPAEGRVTIELGDLAFDDYDPPELRGDGAPLEPEDFPPAVARLHGREVELEGFPLVTRLEGEQADRLLVTRFPPGCCFGTVPVLDEWVAVELAEGKVDPGTGYEPVRVRGELLAGEVVDAGGEVESLYRLVEARVVE